MSSDRACVLVVTEPFDPHADAVIHCLTERNVRVMRWHPEDMPGRAWVNVRVENGRMIGELGDLYRSCASDEITAAWYRRPRAPADQPLHVPSLKRYRQEQCRAALSALWQCIPNEKWVAPPHAIAIAELKPLQLTAAAAAGFGVPMTLFSNHPSTVRQFKASLDLGRHRCAVKAHRGETVADEVCFRVPLTSIWHSEVDISDAALAAAPSIYQPYVDKAVEIRCVVIGDEVLAAEIDTQKFEQSRIDGRSMGGIPQRPHVVSPALRESALALVRSFGLQFSSMDLVLTPDDRYVFLDLNPNGQWLWLEYEAGLPLTEAMVRFLAREHPVLPVTQ